jgi:nitroimidazol reductase NimA-like FMN-containing flavoprotein (pyridoxamine 5'-phosphate oxidase superfamily)
MYGELSATQIETLLRAEVTAHLGCFDGNRPYVVPISYLYDRTYVYGFTREGMKLRAMRAHPLVCVQVERVDGITNWRSVVAWGTFEELAGAEAEEARQRLVSHFTPLLGGASVQRTHGMEQWGSHAATWRDAVLYRIALTTKTGRYETP